MGRLLLVDDSSVMRRMLQNFLESSDFEGFEFLHASNGQEALKILEEVNYKVDAVLCDLCMPVMDGEAFLDVLRERGILPSLPVLILTADATKSLKLRGAAALLPKPFTSAVVSRTLTGILSAKNRSG